MYVCGQALSKLVQISCSNGLDTHRSSRLWMHIFESVFISNNCRYDWNGTPPVGLCQSFSASQTWLLFNIHQSEVWCAFATETTRCYCFYFSLSILIEDQRGNEKDREEENEREIYKVEWNFCMRGNWKSFGLGKRGPSEDEKDCPRVPGGIII